MRQATAGAKEILYLLIILGAIAVALDQIWEKNVIAAHAAELEQKRKAAPRGCGYVVELRIPSPGMAV